MNRQWWAVLWGTTVIALFALKADAERWGQIIGGPDAGLQIELRTITIVEPI